MKALILIILSFISFNLSANFKVESFKGVSLKTEKEIDFDISKSNKPLVLIFISKDCPCSKGNLGYINELSLKYSDFQFIGIHSKKGSTIEEIRNYLKDKKVNFEIVADSQLQIASKFNALKTPHVFIVNQQGEVIYNGGVTSSTFPENAKEFYLSNTLEDIKNHRSIAKKETKTLGCYIVR